MIGTLEQKLAVNPFGKRIEVDRKPESTQEVEMPNRLDEAVERAFSAYKNISYSPFTNFNDVLSQNIQDTLNPLQIQMLFQTILSKHSFSEIGGELTLTISHLIQKCHDNTGENNFFLAGYPIYYLCNELKGKTNSRLTLKIIGDTGPHFADRSSEIDFIITGDAQMHCGQNSKNSNYIINGNAGECCGFSSQDCKFKIKGHPGESLGFWSISNTYIIESFDTKSFNYTINSGSFPRECVFATEKIDVYGQLKNYLHEHEHLKKYTKQNQNKIRLLGKNDSILEEVDV